MIVEKTGDIFTTKAQVIGHGVNAKSLMGAGIARTVANRYPEVKRAYIEHCKSYSGKEKELLGTSFLTENLSDNKIIANIFSQFNPGADARLEALENGLIDTFGQMVTRGLNSLALPRIGAGIGGLDWEEEVYPLIARLAGEYPSINVEVWTFA